MYFLKSLHDLRLRQLSKLAEIPRLARTVLAGLIVTDP
jgi:hypothetical protein